MLHTPRYKREEREARVRAASLLDFVGLQQFHDEFMKLGMAPIPIVRRIMLGNDSPAL